MTKFYVRRPDGTVLKTLTRPAILVNTNTRTTVLIDDLSICEARRDAAYLKYAREHSDGFLSDDTYKTMRRSLAVVRLPDDQTEIDRCHNVYGYGYALYEKTVNKT